MSLLILHLTDLHLKKDSNYFVDRADKIVDAALSPMMDIDDIHVVLSGDIANWGLPEEFKMAMLFIERLTTKILERSKIKPRIIVVAGNHDCNFSDDQSLRDVVIQGVRTKQTQITQKIAEQLSSVLNGFFEFQLQVSTDVKQRKPWLATLEVDDPFPVRYVLLNSAVMSLKVEELGKLYVPVPEIEPGTGDHRTVYVMHHPYGWFQLDNARELAQHAPIAGDLFLMGHEHEHWAQQVSELYNESTITYLKGHVLRDPDNTSNSAFQTIQLNSASGYLPRSYTWNGSSYIPWEEKSKSDFIKWPSMNGHRKLAICADAYKELTSAGANFTHRNKDAIGLTDIFVWPNLKRANLEKDVGNSMSDGLDVSSDCLLENCHDLPPIVVVKGGEQYGKSALAKMLALQLNKKGIYPILLAASKVSSWRERSLNERVNSAINLMYGDKSREEYKQLAPENKLLIIDDFDLSQVTKGYFDGLRALKQHFGHIYLMLDSHPGMEVALNEFLRDECFVNSEIYEIVPSNYHHRLQLIERWLMIGSSDEVSIENLKLMAAKLSKVVDETLGRNLIPSVPVFVLIVLQRAETAQDLNTVVKSGSHGFLYESLIHQALSGKVKAGSVVTSLTYLTALAGVFELRKIDSLTQVEFDSFHVEHCKKFALDIPLSVFQAQLVTAEILDDRRGGVRFMYPFHQYYFLARYISHIQSWTELEPKIDDLVGSIHTERNANVLLFLAHLGRNPRIAEKILNSADKMFSTYEEVDLFKRVDALQKFSLTEIRQIIFEGSKSMQILQHQQDEISADKAAKELAEVAEARLQARLDDALAMNAAFKTLQVLGQVLRNHAGEIERDEKHRITASCVSLGLRVLGSLYDLVSAHGDEMIAFRGMQIRSENPDASEVEVADEMEKYIPAFLSSITVGTLIKIANAIGSEDLLPTITDVLSISDSRHFLKLVIQLEHFSDFPRQEILDYQDDVLSHGGFLPNAVLRRFIVRRFYLFPVRDELRRAVLDKFSIKALPFSFLEQRKLPKYQ